MAPSINQPTVIGFSGYVAGFELERSVVERSLQIRLDHKKRARCFGHLGLGIGFVAGRPYGSRQGEVPDFACREVLWRMPTKIKRGQSRLA